MDYERCIGIADELKRLGERLGDLATEGGAMTATLADSWGGDDCDRFVVDWHFSAKPALVDGGDDITAYAQKLRTQAVEQDLVSALDGPMQATSTAKSTWDRAKDGAVGAMRRAAKFMNDTVDRYPILYLMPGGTGLAMKSGADTVNSAANWIDDPKQAAEDWKDKPRWEQGLDVVSILPVGRPVGAAGRALKGLFKAKKSVNKTTDVTKRAEPPKGSDGGGKPLSEMSDQEVQKEIGGDLKSHEGGPHNGHTMEKHVGKSDEDLVRRANGLDGGKAPKGGTSSYPDQASAERTIAENLRTNDKEINDWLKDPNSRHAKSFDAEHDHVTGRHVDKNGSTATDVHRSRVVLIKDPDAPKGYRIGTSYPKPDNE